VAEIFWVVAPLLQMYEAAPAGPFNVTLPPIQKLVEPLAEIVGVEGFELTVTEVAVDANEVQPVLIV